MNISNIIICAHNIIIELIVNTKAQTITIGYELHMLKKNVLFKFI